MLTDGMAERLIALGQTWTPRSASAAALRQHPPAAVSGYDPATSPRRCASWPATAPEFITGQKLDVDGGYAV